MAKKLTMRDRTAPSGRRLRPARRLLRERGRALRPQLRRDSGSRTTARRTSAADPAWAEMADLAEGAASTGTATTSSRSSPPGSGQEFSADNAFQTGKVAMTIDGEYRKALHPGPRRPTSTTAPRRSRSPTTRPSSLRRRLHHRQHHRHRQGQREPRGRLGADEVPDHRHRRGRQAGQRRSRTCRRPRRRCSRPDLGHGRRLPDVPRHLRQPELSDDAGQPATAAPTRTPSARSSSKWQAGKVADLQAGLDEVDKQINDALALGQAP